MKVVSFLVLIILVSCNGPQALPPEVVKVVPQGYDINAPMFAHAKKELLEAVESCGAGVVDGAEGENRCAYTVKVDDLLLTHPAEKTGLLPDPQWPFKQGVEFVQSGYTGPLPDSYDLRDFMANGQPEIKQQKCGDCWAWASHHGYEIAQAVHDGKVVDDSVQTILSCSKQGTCNGGYMSAVDFIRNGVPLEGAFPYLNGVTGTCKFSSTELSKGWEPKVIGTPYLGSSMSYSSALMKDGDFAAQPSVEEMKRAMYEWKAPLVVTVAAYSISGDGVYDSCSAINSGGNHMVTIVGWEKWQGKDVAKVWNSWGKSHGKDGVSRIVWECGAGKLNRGLGRSAKVVQYKPACAPPKAVVGPAKQTLLEGSFVKLGAPQKDQKCSWTPRQGLTDPDSCETYAAPDMTTEYHLSATNDCGTSSAMTTVEVWGPKGPSTTMRTPYGETSLR